MCVCLYMYPIVCIYFYIYAHISYECMCVSHTASKLYLWYCAQERVQVTGEVPITLEIALAMSVMRVGMWSFVRVCGQVAGSGDGLCQLLTMALFQLFSLSLL